jgi:hypothetical protein
MANQYTKGPRRTNAYPLHLTPDELDRARGYAAYLTRSLRVRHTVADVLRGGIPTDSHLADLLKLEGVSQPTK